METSFDDDHDLGLGGLREDGKETWVKLCGARKDPKMKVPGRGYW